MTNGHNRSFAKVTPRYLTYFLAVPLCSSTISWSYHHHHTTITLFHCLKYHNSNTCITLLHYHFITITLPRHYHSVPPTSHYHTTTIFHHHIITTPPQHYHSDQYHHHNIIIRLLSHYSTSIS